MYKDKRGALKKQCGLDYFLSGSVGYLLSTTIILDDCALLGNI